MQRKDCGGEPPGPGTPGTVARSGCGCRLEAGEQQSEQAGGGRVQGDIEQMIAKDRVAPDFMLQPKGAV